MTLLFALLACAPDAPSAAAGAPKAPVPVRVEVLAGSPSETAQAATGIVEAIDSAELRAEVAGLVDAVHFEDGARVRRGQLLVSLRDVDARAQLDEARARQRLATLARDRRAALVSGGDVSQAELDAAEAELTLANVAVTRAEEALRRTRISAPFDGVVGRRGVAPGERIDTTRLLTRLEGLAHLVVDVGLPESAVAAIALGQPAVVTVDALPGRDLLATVSYVAPRVDPATRTLGVRVAIDAEDAALRPGLTASVRIVTATRSDALQVPTQAVIRSADGAAVYIVVDGKAALRPIRTGVRTEDRVEAVSGLAAGDSVVIEGLARIRPGAAVKIEEEAGVPPPGGAGASPASAGPHESPENRGRIPVAEEEPPTQSGAIRGYPGSAEGFPAASGERQGPGTDAAGGSRPAPATERSAPAPAPGGAR